MANEITKQDLAVALKEAHATLRTELRTELRADLRTDVRGIVDEAIDGFAGMISRSFNDMREETREQFKEVHERVDRLEEGQRLIVREMESGFAAIEQRFDQENEDKTVIKETLSNHETRLRRLEA